MKKVIDLSVFQDITMEVKLPKNEVIRLQKPTQAMVIELMKFQNLSEEDGAEEIIKSIDDISLMILNTNDEFKVFDEKYLDEYLNTQMKVQLIQAYSEFILGVQSDPN